jgi:hypothetical protein
MIVKVAQYFEWQRKLREQGKRLAVKPRDLFTFALLRHMRDPRHRQVRERYNLLL